MLHFLFYSCLFNMNQLLAFRFLLNRIYLKFGREIPNNTTSTPIHCSAATCSPNTTSDMNTAVGNSDELRIGPRPLPTLGIAILNNNGGKTTPKKPRINPQKKSPPPKNEPSVKKTGGNTSHAVNNDPVAISILFVIAGTVMPTRPLTLIKAVKLTAASRPQNTPVAERPSSEAPNTSAPSNEPTNKITAEIHFSTVGKRRSNSHSANK